MLAYVAYQPIHLLDCLLHMLACVAYQPIYLLDCKLAYVA